MSSHNEMTRPTRSLDIETIALEVLVRAITVMRTSLSFVLITIASRATADAANFLPSSQEVSKMTVH